jgi:hypothetical protein
MRTVSKTSSARWNDKVPSSPAVAMPESARERRRRLKEEYASIAPPNPRRRKREARRWLDVLGVRCTNGRVCERRPGQQLLTFKESEEIHRTGLEQLQAADPQLFKAVQRVMWEVGLEDLGTTLAEWKVNAAQRTRRLSKIRAEMQRAGSI